MRRVISLWFPTFATDRLSRRRGAGRRRAETLVTVEEGRGAGLILAVSAAAQREGVVPGMTTIAAAALLCELGVTRDRFTLMGRPIFGTAGV